MRDFKVKPVKDLVHAVRYGAMPNKVVFLTRFGLQIVAPENPGPIQATQLTPQEGRLAFEYTSHNIQGIFEVIDDDLLKPFHANIYKSCKLEGEKRYEAHTRKLWDRVPIGTILDYIDRIGEYADSYDSIAEMGYDDKPMICADWNPPKMKRLANWIEKFYHGNIEVDWSDEWTSCSDCYSAVRSQADSYGWEPSYVWISECELICKNCALEKTEDVIEYYQNHKSRALPSWFEESIEKAGYHCLETEEAYCARFETGFHRGQDDTPEKALKLAKEILPYKFDYLFMITDRGQFDIHWTMYVRKQEVEVES